MIISKVSAEDNVRQDLKKRSLGEYRTSLLGLSVIHRSMDLSRVWVCLKI